MIPTRALPLMSYRVPEELDRRIQVGSAVVAPLSGYSRLGIVVEVGQPPVDGRGLRELEKLEKVRRVVGGLSLGPELVGLCRWISENAALPLPVVLRNALPSGLRTDLYRVTAPAAGWSWRRGALVERSSVRKSLGKDGLKEAEAAGRIVLSPAPARRESVEWVVPRIESDTGSGSGIRGAGLSRAPRQRELLEKILDYGACRVRPLLEETGARRQTLKGLADRGAVRLERRSGSSPVTAARGPGNAGGPAPISAPAGPDGSIGRLVERRGGYLWRVPGGEQARVVADLCRVAAGRWEQTLVLVPEVRDVERTVSELTGLLPAGTTVAPYHSGLGRERTAVHEAARQGAVDVLVGTRAASLLPLSRVGVICVLDEPDPAHRAEPGFEGIPLHVRDVSLERGRREDAAVFALSPTPSLWLYAASKEDQVEEMPAREPASWPEARVVDMRGSGAAIGRDLLEACREGMVAGGGVGVVVNRLGYATSVYCSRCGSAAVCESCGLPLVLHATADHATGSGKNNRRELVCYRCAYRRPLPEGCDRCGSGKLVPTGLAVERARELLSERLEEEVGLSTAGRKSKTERRVVVGTAHAMLGESRDTVLVPDADSLLFGGGVYAAERGFRTLYSAASSAKRRVVVQTRDPDNAVLGAALRGDYPAFAAHELPRRKRAGYPPYRHLAALTLRGNEAAVRRAVESLAEPRETGVETLDPVPLEKPPKDAGASANVWRVMLRADRRPDLAGVISTVAQRIPAERRGKGGRRSPDAARDEVYRVEIELDPEEV